MTFSEKLTELRKHAGETQEVLGEFLGVSGKTISKWESGATEPDLTALLAIADHYQVTADVLLGRESPSDVKALIHKEMQAQNSTAACFHRAFEYSHHIIASMFDAHDNPDTEPLQDAVPSYRIQPISYRTNVELSMGALITYVTEDVRLGIQVYRNPAEFRWLYEDREKLASLFALLGDPDALAALYTMERADFSMEFTAVYLAEKAGIPPEKAEAILETLLTFKGLTDTGHLSRSTIETLAGNRTFYRFDGSGAVMGLVSLAKILTDGWEGNNCMSWNGLCRMIGEKEGNNNEAR